MHTLPLIKPNWNWWGIMCLIYFLKIDTTASLLVHLLGYKWTASRGFQNVLPRCAVHTVFLGSCHRAPSLKRHAAFVTSLQMAMTAISWLSGLIWNRVVISADWGAAVCVSHAGRPAGVLRWITDVFSVQKCAKKHSALCWCKVYVKYVTTRIMNMIQYNWLKVCLFKPSR